MNLYFIPRLWHVHYTFIVAIKGQPEFKALNKFSPTHEAALIAFTLLLMHRPVTVVSQPLSFNGF